MDIYMLISLMYYYINKDVFRKGISEEKKKEEEEEKVCLCICLGVLSFLFFDLPDLSRDVGW